MHLTVIFFLMNDYILFLILYKEQFTKKIHLNNRANKKYGRLINTVFYIFFISIQTFYTFALAISVSFVNA
jgi:hypothetical protein